MIAKRRIGGEFIGIMIMSLLFIIYMTYCIGDMIFSHGFFMVLYALFFLMGFVIPVWRISIRETIVIKDGVFKIVSNKEVREFARELETLVWWKEDVSGYGERILILKFPDQEIIISSDEYNDYDEIGDFFILNLRNKRKKKTGMFGGKP